MTTAARTLRVTCPVADLYVTVTEGRKSECYRLEIGYRTVRWVHTGDAARGGIVCVNGAGKAVGCDCKAALYNRGCKHRAGVETMIARGMIEVPVVTEANEAMRDQPDGWLHTTEAE